MSRRISIFGSTGSIGANTVDLLESQPSSEGFEIEVLTAQSNAKKLASQARRLNAKRAVIGDEAKLPELSRLLAGSDCEALGGIAALHAAADVPVDWAMSAIVGAAGLMPTVKLAAQGCTLALANKESLVCAGPFLLDLCKKSGTQLLPVDSEHSAIFQCLAGAPEKEIERIILTASGGPFRTWDVAEIRKATVSDALKHPNWSMGERITIDSASMFNKALEVIEAAHLFNVRTDQIEIVIHPQSIVHSMVGFTDGAVLAQLGPPDMRGPIGYALNYPNRQNLPVERIDFTQIGNLNFEAPNQQKFPAISLAFQALEIGGAAGAVLNAAKEAALDAFLSHRIGFGDMATLVNDAIEEFGEEASTVVPGDGLEPIFEFDKRAREHVVAQIARKKDVQENLAGKQWN